MSVCARCGATFSCGMVEDLGSQPCWCRTLPVASSEALDFLRSGEDKGKHADSCFCATCLRAASDAFPAIPGQQR